MLGMGTTFTPALHPSEYQTEETEDLYMDLASRSAHTFMVNVLGLPWESIGSINPTDVLIREDELVVMASALDAVDTDHAIEGYWTLRLAEFLDVARWADRKGRDILWS